jgi:hypothetical protein
MWSLSRDRLSSILLSKHYLCPFSIRERLFNAFWYTTSTFISNGMLQTQHCIAEAVAVCSVCCISLIYRMYVSNCMCRWLDRNGSRRWLLNFCCKHIQMALLCTTPNAAFNWILVYFWWTTSGTPHHCILVHHNYSHFQWNAAFVRSVWCICWIYQNAMTLSVWSKR